MSLKNIWLAVIGITGIGCLIVGLYLAFGSGQSNSKPSSEPPRTNNEIEIPFSVAWTNTNIQVHKGQRLVIKATGKGVWKSIADSNPNAYPKPYEESEPDGTPPVDAKDYYSNISSYQCPQAYKGALIGKIGQYGIAFPVGSNFSQIADKDGVLFLGINDMKPEIDNTSLADNSGSFVVNIQATGSATFPGKNVVIPANVMWFDTGIDVTDGLSLKYRSGTWTSGGEVLIWSDANGSGSWPGLLLPNAPFRGLIGKVGSNIFFAGNGYEGKPGVGRLFLSINDKPDTFDDNQGQIEVAISVK